MDVGVGLQLQSGPEAGESGSRSSADRWMELRGAAEKLTGLEEKTEQRRCCCHTVCKPEQCSYISIRTIVVLLAVQPKL